MQKMQNTDTSVLRELNAMHKKYSGKAFDLFVAPHITDGLHDLRLTQILHVL